MSQFNINNNDNLAETAYEKAIEEASKKLEQINLQIRKEESRLKSLKGNSTQTAHFEQKIANLKVDASKEKRLIESLKEKVKPQIKSLVRLPSPPPPVKALQAPGPAKRPNPKSLKLPRTLFEITLVKKCAMEEKFNLMQIIVQIDKAESELAELEPDLSDNLSKGFKGRDQIVKKLKKLESQAKDKEEVVDYLYKTLKQGTILTIEDKENDLRLEKQAIQKLDNEIQLLKEDPQTDQEALNKAIINAEKSKININQLENELFRLGSDFIVNDQDQPIDIRIEATKNFKESFTKELISHETTLEIISESIEKAIEVCSKSKNEEPARQSWENNPIEKGTVLSQDNLGANKSSKNEIPKIEELPIESEKNKNISESPPIIGFKSKKQKETQVASQEIEDPLIKTDNNDQTEVKGRQSSYRKEIGTQEKQFKSSGKKRKNSRERIAEHNADIKALEATNQSQPEKHNHSSSKINTETLHNKNHDDRVKSQPDLLKKSSQKIISNPKEVSSAQNKDSLEKNISTSIQVIQEGFKEIRNFETLGEEVISQLEIASNALLILYQKALEHQESLPEDFKENLELGKTEGLKNNILLEDAVKQSYELLKQSQIVHSAKSKLDLLLTCIEEQLVKIKEAKGWLEKVKDRLIGALPLPESQSLEEVFESISLAENSIKFGEEKLREKLIEKGREATLILAGILNLQVPTTTSIQISIAPTDEERKHLATTVNSWNRAGEEKGDDRQNREQKNRKKQTQNDSEENEE